MILFLPYNYYIQKTTTTMNSTKQQQLIKFLCLDTEANRINDEAIQSFGAGAMKCNVEVKSKTLTKMVSKINKCFNTIKRVPQVMEIIGGGPAANCHQNARRAELFLNDKQGMRRYEKVVGYNFSFCDCSKAVSAEIHSVIKDTETGKYYDFTTDFGGEKIKTFLECDKLQEKHTYMELIFDDRRKIDFITSMYEKHTCGKGLTFSVEDYMLKFNEMEQIIEESNFEKFVKPPHYTSKTRLTKEQYDYLIETEWEGELEYLGNSALSVDKGGNYNSEYNKKSCLV